MKRVEANTTHMTDRDADQRRSCSRTPIGELKSRVLGGTVGQIIYRTERRITVLLPPNPKGHDIW